MRAMKSHPTEEHICANAFTPSVSGPATGHLAPALQSKLSAFCSNPAQLTYFQGFVFVRCASHFHICQWLFMTIFENILNKFDISVTFKISISNQQYGIDHRGIFYILTGLRKKRSLARNPNKNDFTDHLDSTDLPADNLLRSGHKPWYEQQPAIED